MKKKVDILIANPSGNITIFVLTPFERKDYQEVTNQLMAMKEFKGEQVGFIKEPHPGVDGKMEMSGLEFCGNASRSFGLLCALRDKKQGKCQSVVDVSGCDDSLVIDIDLNTNYTKVKMPNYKSVSFAEAIGAYVVDLGGIVHAVFDNQEEDYQKFLEAKQYIQDKYDPAALGAMFYNSTEKKLIPIVYVKDVDATCWEGSCGSGSASVAIAMTSKRKDGEYRYQIKQPAGEITVSAIKEQGEVTDIFIEGPVELSEVKTVTIEI